METTSTVNLTRVTGGFSISGFYRPVVGSSEWRQGSIAADCLSSLGHPYRGLLEVVAWPFGEVSGVDVQSFVRSRVERQ